MLARIYLIDYTRYESYFDLKSALSVDAVNSREAEKILSQIVFFHHFFRGDTSFDVSQTCCGTFLFSLFSTFFLMQKKLLLFIFATPFELGITSLMKHKQSI